MHVELLGAKVRDKVTGVVGIVTTVSEHLTGCARAWVERPMNEKGETPEGLWLDVTRVEVVELGAVKLDDAAVAASPSPSDVGNPHDR
jgi:hypothetical protein